jgi:hypothetical protein
MASTKPVSRPGVISLTFSHGSGGSRVNFTIHDEISNVRVLEASVDYPDFASMFNSQTTCDYRVGAFELLGMERQRCEHNVFAPRLWALPAEDRERVAKQALAPYEKDGWKGRVDDLTNSHQRLDVSTQEAVQLALRAGLDAYVEDEVRGSVQVVTFTRYVDPASGEPVVLRADRPITRGEPHEDPSVTAFHVELERAIVALVERSVLANAVDETGEEYVLVRRTAFDEAQRLAAVIRKGSRPAGKTRRKPR